MRELISYLLTTLEGKGIIEVVEEEGKLKVRRVRDESGGLCEVLDEEPEGEEHS